MKENMPEKSRNCCEKNSKNSTGALGSFKPVLFIVLLPVVVIFAAIVLINAKADKSNVGASPVNSAQTVDSTIELDKVQFSFGEVSQAKGNVETEYTLTNTGSADFLVKRLYTSCMCTRAQIMFSDGSTTNLNGMLGHGPTSDLVVNKTIKAGETVIIRAVFDPNAHGPQGVGFIKRNITLETNLKNSPTIQVSFDAEVTK